MSNDSLFDQVPKKPEKWMAWAAFGVVTLFLIWASSQNDDSISTTRPRTQVTQPAARLVKYTVFGTAGRVDVTLENDSGGSEQHGDMAVPYTYYGRFEPGDFVYISAQNQGTSGTLTCAIWVGDTVVSSGKASGAYSICSASGSVGR